MICKSYNQLTIVEKTQFVGKLLHLIQTEESAYLIADDLIQKANSDGWFNRVVILPREEALCDCEEVLPDYSQTTNPVFEVINSAEFLASHSYNPVIDLFYKTKHTIQRSYHKFFTKLAS